VRESSRDDNDLSSRREVSVDIVNLVLESLVEQFIGFIENEHLDVSYRSPFSVTQLTLISLVLRFLRRIISNTRPGVPLTTC
jgi:hypothetical protein